MDTLFLLKPGFEDPAYPGQTFYCWHCALMEGVLASFPHLAKKLKIRHIDWRRPRREVVALLGEVNQSLPVLILDRDAASEHASGSHDGRVFIADKDAILAVLSERHGFPVPHP